MQRFSGFKEGAAAPNTRLTQPGPFFNLSRESAENGSIVFIGLIRCKVCRLSGYHETIILADTRRSTSRRAAPWTKIPFTSHEDVRFESGDAIMDSAWTGTRVLTKQAVWCRPLVGHAHSPSTFQSDLSSPLRFLFSK